MLLATPHLTLRKFTPSDFGAFAALMADPEVMRFSLKGPLSTEEARENFQKRVLGHYEKYGFGLWAIFQKGEDELVGFAGLISQNIDGKEEIELAFRLNPKYWGKGYATEAAKEICRYAFDTLGLDRLISIIDPKNHRSLKVASRVGMHFWKEAVFHGFDVRIFALNKIVVAAPHPSWPIVFKEEKNKLEPAFKGLDIEFHHIGSTSIPGCAAKPIIDILGVTPDITEVDKYNSAIEALGYVPMGEYGMMQRRFFQRKYPNPINLHIFELTDPEAERHLRFKQYLIEHPEKMREYSEIKQKMSAAFPHDMGQYILGKIGFIKNIDIAAAKESKKKMMKEASKKKTWSNEEILKAMQVNMHLHMIYFTKFVPTMDLVVEMDVTVVQSDIPDDTYNYVLAARFTDSNASHRVAHVIKLFQKKRLPFSWWVGELDTPSDLGEILVHQGLAFKEEDAGMYLDLEQFKPAKDSSLVFERVITLDRLKDFSQVIVEVGGSSQSFDLLYSKVPPLLYQEGSSFEMYVGYLDKIPVVTGVAVLHGNVAGLYYIATVPHQRKKGYGSAMMEHLIKRAKSKGYFIATLQASQEGKSLYERLGFKACCKFREYA